MPGRAQCQHEFIGWLRPLSLLPLPLGEGTGQNQCDSVLAQVEGQ